MRLTERIFPVAIFFVMGICCIGAYVAVSGFMIASPNGPDFTFLNTARTAAAFAPGTVTFPTETSTLEASAPTPALTPTRSVTPTITPRGFNPTATRAATEPALPTAVPNVTFAVTRQPATPNPQAGQPGQTVAPTLASASSGACGFEFCPQLGPPEASIAPTNKPCPTDYLWGQALDENGNGVGGSLGWKISAVRQGGESANFPLKSRPDPEGIWNVPTGGGGSWTLQLLDGNGRPLSSKYSIAAGNPNGAGGTCGTHVDFKKVTGG